MFWSPSTIPQTITRRGARDREVVEFESQLCMTTWDGTTFAASSTRPKVPAFPRNDQHAPVELPKTVDGATGSKPGVVSLGETTAPVFKEAKS